MCAEAGTIPFCFCSWFLWGKLSVDFYVSLLGCLAFAYVDVGVQTHIGSHMCGYMPVKVKRCGQVPFSIAPHFVWGLWMDPEITSLAGQAWSRDHCLALPNGCHGCTLFRGVLGDIQLGMNL